MRRSLLILLLVALVAAPLAHAIGTIEPAQSRALLRVVSKLSGLPIRRSVPVVAESAIRFRQRRLLAYDRAYPSALQRHDEALYLALGLTSSRGVLRKALVASQVQPALYDSQTRKLYVLHGQVSRTSVLEELVHALQDQTFDLRRTRALVGSRDASLAASAALAGHASFVAGLLGPRAGPSVGGPALTRFLALENGFASTVGRRFAVTLRNLGGNPAVFSALRRFPETTEQIFHIDKFLERERAIPIVLPVDAAGLTLVSDSTFGELDVRALLATFGVPRLDRVGTGWGGGRSAVYRRDGREAVTVTLSWDDELDAVEWGEAVRAYVGRAFDKSSAGPPAQTPCAASACWNLAGQAVAFERSADRTALVLGTDPAAAARLARTLLGLA